jgi:hypothetical protein
MLHKGELILIERLNGLDGSTIERYRLKSNEFVEYRRYKWRGSRWWSIN